MPLTVTAWPYFPDPRVPQFGLTGYAFGMVPPERYSLKTVGALGAFANLNTGVLVIATDIGPADVHYDDGPPVRQALTKFGFPQPQGVPLHTIRLQLQAIRPGEDMHVGFILQVFPPAIQVFVITMQTTGIGPNQIPNPVTCTPENFLVLP